MLNLTNEERLITTESITETNKRALKSNKKQAPWKKPLSIACFHNHFFTLDNH